jgi:hypothetical protein
MTLMPTRGPSGLSDMAAHYFFAATDSFQLSCAVNILMTFCSDGLHCKQMSSEGDSKMADGAI